MSWKRFKKWHPFSQFTLKKKTYGKQKDNNCSQHLIRRKTLSRSFFISIKVRVWSRKRSFICCSRTLDRPLKLMSISLVFSKRSSLDSEVELHKCLELQACLWEAVYKMRWSEKNSHVSLGLDDCVHVLRVDHAQHPAAEDSWGSRIHSAASKQTARSVVPYITVSVYNIKCTPTCELQSMYDPNRVEEWMPRQGFLRHLFPLL